MEKNMVKVPDFGMPDKNQYSKSFLKCNPFEQKIIMGIYLTPLGLYALERSLTK